MAWVNVWMDDVGGKSNGKGFQYDLVYMQVGKGGSKGYGGYDGYKGQKGKGKGKEGCKGAAKGKGKGKEPGPWSYCKAPCCDHWNFDDRKSCVGCYSPNPYIPEGTDNEDKGKAKGTGNAK